MYRLWYENSNRRIMILINSQQPVDLPLKIEYYFTLISIELIECLTYTVQNALI